MLMRCGRQGETTTLSSLMLNIKCFNNLGYKNQTIFPGRRWYKVLQIVNKQNPCKIIGTWNARTMLQMGKLTNWKIEMDRLNIEILVLCETRWGGNGHLTSDQWRVIHSRKQTGKAGVAVYQTVNGLNHLFDKLQFLTDY